MNDASRDGRTPHAKGRPRISRLGIGDAEALLALLTGQDVWPRPRSADIIEFLGRNDAATFGLRAADGLRGAVSTLVEGAVAHVLWIAFDPDTVAEMRLALEELAAFAKASGSAMLFAQVEQGSAAHRALLGCGFAEDYDEREVTRGRPRILVDLVRALG
ncbi:MAG TPA: hypothetical protein VEJ41_02300 [Candidatus Acidoferrales bacterium]|nr:hypothetical protein [Candidatus Acidoferrales bacterium]